jgi:hypothetical protein
VIHDSVPRDRMHCAGSGWSLEGNAGALELLADLPSGVSMTFELWYTSNGDYHPHYADGGTLDATKSIVTLDNTPTIGRIDRRVNAYAGGVLRLLPDSPAPIEERLIVSSAFSAPSTWTATVNLPFTHASAGTVKYEIAPAGSNSMYEAIACRAAMKLGVPRKITQGHMASLLTEYKMAMKTIGDNLTGMQARSPASFVRDTVDNPLGRQWGFWGH